MGAGLRERRILYATAFARAVTTSLVGVLLGAWLGRRGLDGALLGAVVSAGLAGATLAAVVATLRGDRIGRRRLLVVLALLSAAGSLAFAWSEHPVALAAAAFVGMLNGMGRDRGAALVLEQAALPGTTTDAGRTAAIAGYTVLQDVGHALGALLAGLPALAAPDAPIDPYRAVLCGCAALSLGSAGLYAAVGDRLEPPRGSGARLLPESRSILVRLSALFAVDALAGGFLTTALLSWFFFERFGADEGSVALLFFGARVMNAVSHLGAAWLAGRIGLVNTMVFTHLPSSLLLVTVAFAPSFPVAAVLFLLREGLVEMDVPTRQSYVLAVVRPEERTFASGVTNLVRLGSWAVAPAFAGLLATGGALHVPLVIGAGMKIAYDLLLWRAFRAVRPPEET